MKNDSGYKLFWFLFIWIVGALFTFGYTAQKVIAAGYDEVLFLVCVTLLWPIILGSGLAGGV